MGSSQSTAYLPPSSAAIMIYLAQQRFEKEAPWKRDQLTKQVRGDPDVLALSCWAVACEQPPGAIPNPGGVQTPQQFVVSFRAAVKVEPAASALDSWYAAMKLPIPGIYLRQEDELDPHALDGWFCASPRSFCGPREMKQRLPDGFGTNSATGPMPGSTTYLARGS
jgi:hypothetical protein